MISLTRVGSKNSPELAAIVEALEGQSYMCLHVLCCPDYGEFQINVTAMPGYNDSEIREMVLMILCNRLGELHTASKGA